MQYDSHIEFAVRSNGHGLKPKWLVAALGERKLLDDLKGYGATRDKSKLSSHAFLGVLVQAWQRVCVTSCRQIAGNRGGRGNSGTDSSTPAWHLLNYAERAMLGGHRSSAVCQWMRPPCVQSQTPRRQPPRLSAWAAAENGSR